MMALQRGRRYSVLSQAALNGVGRCTVEAADLEQRMASILARLSPSSEGTPAPPPHDPKALAARAELAQLEAAVARLETGGVDSLYTGHLVTGKDEVKMEKRRLLARTESLFTQLEDAFQKLKAPARPLGEPAGVVPAAGAARGQRCPRREPAAVPRRRLRLKTPAGPRTRLGRKTPAAEVPWLRGRICREEPPRLAKAAREAPPAKKRRCR